MPYLTRMLKLMTYNIHNGTGRDHRYDLDRIARLIQEETPDIVALQEVDNGLPRTQCDDQSRLLATRLGMYHHHCVTCKMGGGEYGITVLSAFPPLCNHRFDITHHTSREARSVMRVDVEVEPGAVLHVFNCHLGLMPGERRWQRRQMLSEAILLSRDLRDPVVLMGDFNDRPLSVVHVQLRRLFQDAYTRTGKRYGPTFHKGPLRWRLDHIYTSPHLHVVDCWVRNDRLARVASDHRPLLALVEVQWERVGAAQVEQVQRLTAELSANVLTP